MKAKRLNLNDTKKLCLVAFIASVVVHLVYFIVFYFNGAILHDEAMLLLNARHIADFQTDCLGERLPVYFDTWLFGGQSPVATYAAALFIKLFGYDLAVTRIPMFAISIIGLVAFYYFLNNVFKDKRYVAVIFVLACFSPWHIFNSVYTLDCNYMPHVLIIGMALLAKGIRTQRTRYFAFSMLFFGFCFYCYIAAAVIVPLILIFIYLYLLISKRISIKNAIISVAVITAVSVPFILSGLVQFGAIDEFSFLNFSFSKMPYYSRGTTINFSNFAENLGNGIIMLILPDIYMFGGIGMMNSFHYTSFPGGLCFILGLICLTYKYRKSRDKEVETARFFTIPTFITFLIYCSCTFFYTVLYRYFAFNYIFIVIEGIGFVYLSKIVKRLDVKKIIAVFLIVSAIFYNVSYFTTFEKNYVRKNYWYVNSFTDSVEFANELGYESVAVCFDNHEDLTSRGPRNAVALRLYDYENISNYYPLKDDLMMFLNTAEEIPLTKDNRYYYREVSDLELKDDCLIMTSAEMEFANYDKSIYSVKDFGDMVVIYK